LDKVDGLRLEKVLKVHQGRCILASGNRNASILFDPRQPGIVFWRPDELFEPLEIEGAQLARHVECFANGRRAIDVEHYLGVSTCGFAGGACAGDVDLVQFETAKAAAQRPRYVLSDQLGIGVPSGAKLMPHKHPEDRIYTVMSGCPADRPSPCHRRTVRQARCSKRHFDPDDVGARLGRLPDQYGQSHHRRERWKGLPLDVFREDRPEFGLAGRMGPCHGGASSFAHEPLLPTCWRPSPSADGFEVGDNIRTVWRTEHADHHRGT
jgi:hypothetical protein